jgi:adenylate cyclase
MRASRRVWLRTPSLTIAGNLIGAILTFFYFRFIDEGARRGAAPVGPWEIAYSVIAFSILAALGYRMVHHWAGPLWSFDRHGSLPEAELAPLRRRALLFPYAVAAVTALGWLLAGLIWGVLWPWLAGTLDLRMALRSIFGTTIVAGSVATAFSFLAVESRWRSALPAIFPEGDLSAVVGAPRLPVRIRLLVIFLLISVIPLVLLGVLAYTRALALIGLDQAAAGEVVGRLQVLILFILAVGVFSAVGLAGFAAHSVADPLGRVQSAMAGVGQGDLERRCPVLANDEIGSVAEGFNRMVAGLREREVIRDVFGKYVTREIRDEILAGRASFEGRTEDVTILFADIRDFTPWVERTEPRQVVQELNEYFTEMEAAIRAHHGLVLQYIGDEIEAVFGAPLRSTDHADRALAAAREMRRRLAELNGRRAAAGQPPLRNGIGIHTGSVLAGNIGSAERLTYALVGDAVNLASRLQGLNKELGTDVLLSDATRRRLSGGDGLEPLPAVRVKGKAVEVSVYRVT